MQFYAHSKTRPNGSPAPKEEWEPLFTPFGDGPDECQRESCKKCEDLEPNHGHLNKVAWWCAKFAAEMFSPGPDRDAASQWGCLAGLWHDLEKLCTRWLALKKSLTGVIPIISAVQSEPRLETS